MCLHTKQTRAGSSCSKLGKLDCLVWQTGCSSLIGFGGSQEHHRLRRQSGAPSASARASFPGQMASHLGEGQDP
jgi:hypothetical protein